MAAFFEQSWFLWWFLAIVVVIRWVSAVSARSMDLDDAELQPQELSAIDALTAPAPHARN